MWIHLKISFCQKRINFLRTPPKTIRMWNTKVQYSWLVGISDCSIKQKFTYILLHIFDRNYFLLMKKDTICGKKVIDYTSYFTPFCRERKEYQKSFVVEPNSVIWKCVCYTLFHFINKMSNTFLPTLSFVKLIRYWPKAVLRFL